MHAKKSEMCNVCVSKYFVVSKMVLKSDKNVHFLRKIAFFWTAAIGNFLLSVIKILLLYQLSHSITEMLVDDLIRMSTAA